jgi:hypothetical protein
MEAHVLTLPEVSKGTLTCHREVVEWRLTLVHILRPLLVANEGAVVLEEKVSRPPRFDVFPCEMRDPTEWPQWLF